MTVQNTKVPQNTPPLHDKHTYSNHKNVLYQTMPGIFTWRGHFRLRINHLDNFLHSRVLFVILT